MCGIAGIISKNIENVQIDIVQTMLDALKHRGPDGVGLFQDQSVAMGMRRLSIIDLEGGWQPLYNEDKSLVLVINGEIYNYIELRENLKKSGHTFSTDADGEVILHLYEEYEEHCLEYLRGMFSFMLFDKKNNTVLIARDRMGEKPLYLFETPSSIYFSSEMKSILTSGKVEFELDPIAVNEYFHYQYVPEPRTMIKSVRKLPKAHYMKISLDTFSIEEKKYWDMENSDPVEGSPGELILDEFSKVCDLVIRSDVPVGVALSGGIDSSAIAAVASKKYSGSMKAYSIGYPGRPENDERNHAKKLANKLEMPLNEIELSTADFKESFENLIFDMDDPIADISAFGYYSLSSAASNDGVPVLLQGQGGDELFWGYSDSVQAVELTEARRKKVSLKERSKGFINGFPSTLKVKKGYRPIFQHLSDDFKVAEASFKKYCTDSFLQKLKGTSVYDITTFDAPWDRSDILITRLMCDNYLLQNGIAQGERLSMANSIELRLPFVDYKLIELIIGLRKNSLENPDYKNFPKPWLREAMKDILPAEVLERPKKGFAPPLMEWHNAVFEKYGDYLDQGYLVESNILTNSAGIFLAKGGFPNGNFIKRLLTVSPISFKALVLEIWCRKMKSITVIRN